eukprot:1194397-Prorocentrum_minimum.AAC.11
MGIFSFPFCDWCPQWVYSLSPSQFGACCASMGCPHDDGWAPTSGYEQYVGRRTDIRVINNPLAKLYAARVLSEAPPEVSVVNNPLAKLYAARVLSEAPPEVSVINNPLAKLYAARVLSEAPPE